MIRIHIVNIKDGTAPLTPDVLPRHRHEVEITASGGKAGKMRRWAAEFQHEPQCLVEGHGASHVARGLRSRAEACHHLSCSCSPPTIIKSRFITRTRIGITLPVRSLVLPRPR